MSRFALSAPKDARERLAALRYLTEAELAPVRFAGGAGIGTPVEGATRFFASETPRGSLIDSNGDIPDSEAEALRRIRLLQPPGAEPLEQDGIWMHPCEAANSNFVSDRFMFLGSNTLINIAKGGPLGFAWMNSHRTGGWFSDAELPYGRTYAGRYEQYLAGDGTLYERALIAFYMLRGSKPVGDAGPDTDEMHRMIDGGVLKDVSIGIVPGLSGTRICDVCGASYWGGDCPHYIGSTYQMSDEQKTRQLNRGVPGGVATCTLDSWEPQELSGVFNGAVPGAGFGKAHQALTLGTLPDSVVAELALSYASYL